MWEHRFELKDGRRVVLTIYSGRDMLKKGGSSYPAYDTAIDGEKTGPLMPCPMPWNTQVLENTVRKKYETSVSS